MTLDEYLKSLEELCEKENCYSSSFKYQLIDAVPVLLKLVRKYREALGKYSCTVARLTTENGEFQFIDKNLTPAGEALTYDPREEK